MEHKNLSHVIFEMQLVQKYFFAGTPEFYDVFMTVSEITEALNAKEEGKIKLTPVMISRALSALQFTRESMFNGVYEKKGYYIRHKLESALQSKSAVNDIIQLLKERGIINTNLICDGYHTFGELYEHRITLFIVLCQAIESLEKEYATPTKLWKSKLHSDGSSMDGWFVMGIYTDPGKQITYHLPMSEWEQTAFVNEIERAPVYDGHSSDNVLVRLRSIFNL